MKQQHHYHLVGGNCQQAAAFNSFVLVATLLTIGGLSYLAVRQL